ncbi:helix-turn-helix transcriptional regulator [Maribacter sp. 2-571]|uniref:helix-turn-helix transcriptional regulator n=1 Tax=Maribacter sp. 2-571 TaxID=3417569 RepID=UPI003D3327D7
MSNKPMITDSKIIRSKKSIEAERLTELSVFLTNTRNNINRKDFTNLPPRQRQRSIGLSRSEVAHLAEMSTDWYTWLEQGRAIKVSREMLSKIAVVLKMSAPEKRYFFTLAGHHYQTLENDDYNIITLKRMADNLKSAPTIILNGIWQIIYQNKAANQIFGNWPNLGNTDKNLLNIFFTEPVFTEFLQEWEWHARLTIRQYRAIYAEQMGNIEITRLINRLSERSDLFRNWWMETDVAGRDDGRKIFNIPKKGSFVFDYTILRPAENSSIEMLSFVPVK